MFSQPGHLQQFPSHGQIGEPQWARPHHGAYPPNYGPGYAPPPPNGQYAPQPPGGYGVQGHAQQPPPPPSEFATPQPYGASGGGPGILPRTLLVQPFGKEKYMLVNADNNQPMYSAVLKSSAVQFLRGANGPQCGSAKFHTFSSKIDLNVGYAQAVFKKEMQSTAGQGHLEWKGVTKHWYSSRGHLELESDGSQLAVYRLQKGPDHHELQSGSIEIQGPLMNQAQLDEIVISGIAEIERRRGNNQPSSSAGGGAAAAAAASSSGGC